MLRIRSRSASGKPSIQAFSPPGSGKMWPYSIMSLAGRSTK